MTMDHLSLTVSHFRTTEPPCTGPVLPDTPTSWIFCLTWEWRSTCRMTYSHFSLYLLTDPMSNAVNQYSNMWITTLPGLYLYYILHTKVHVDDCSSTGLGSFTLTVLWSISVQASWSPLHIAASAGRDEIVRTLISKGAQLNSVNQNGCTPLHYAASKDRYKVSLLRLILQ